MAWLLGRPNTLFCVFGAKDKHKKSYDQQKNTRMCISERLKTVLADQSINIKQFAERADLPYRTAQSYLNGERLPNVEGLIKLATHLCIDINWLITGEGPMYRMSDGRGQPAGNMREDGADSPRETMQEWLEDFWARADEKQRAWLEIEFGRSFPEYRRWLEVRQTRASAQPAKSDPDAG